jgi:hypothetical protein
VKLTKKGKMMTYLITDGGILKWKQLQIYVCDLERHKQNTRYYEREKGVIKENSSLEMCLQLYLCSKTNLEKSAQNVNCGHLGMMGFF